MYNDEVKFLYIYLFSNNATLDALVSNAAAAATATAVEANALITQIYLFSTHHLSYTHLPAAHLFAQSLYGLNNQQLGSLTRGERGGVYN